MSCSDLWARALSHVFQCHWLTECVCVCVRHWSWLQSVRRQSRVIDRSSAEWPETRRTYAELFLQIKQQHYYSGPRMSYVIQTAMHERAGAAWHSDSLEGHAAVTCCKKNVRGRESRKSLSKGSTSWREYWQQMIDARLSCAVRTVRSHKFWRRKNCHRSRRTGLMWPI